MADDSLDGPGQRNGRQVATVGAVQRALNRARALHERLVLLDKFGSGDYVGPIFVAR